MMVDKHLIKDRRQTDIIKVARSLYTLVVHEEDKERLELCRKVILEFNKLINEAINEDGLLHPDLGLTLLLFTELKRDGNPESEADRKDALRLIERLEEDQAYTRASRR